jgi:hypothetical protein
MSTDPFGTAMERKATVSPLRKRTLKGVPYARDPRIEARLGELLALPHDQLVEAAAI